MTNVSLGPLDLAALISSRICHDVISPVGAIVNGLEVLDGEADEDMRSIAMDLIKKSAMSASARLQFCRLAFGAAGSLSAAIDTGDAEKVARGLLSNDRTTVEWFGVRQLAPKNVVKLLLNLCLIAAGGIPRGGTIAVSFDGERESMALRVVAKGQNARLSRAAANLLTQVPGEAIDAHSIQPYYTALLAEQCGMALRVETAPDSLTFFAASSIVGNEMAGDTPPPSDMRPAL